jgi:hypothetical protein
MDPGALLLTIYLCHFPRLFLIVIPTNGAGSPPRPTGCELLAAEALSRGGLTDAVIINSCTKECLTVIREDRRQYTASIARPLTFRSFSSPSPAVTVVFGVLLISRLLPPSPAPSTLPLWPPHFKPNWSTVAMSQLVLQLGPLPILYVNYLLTLSPSFKSPPGSRWVQYAVLDLRPGRLRCSWGMYRFINRCEARTCQIYSLPSPSASGFFLRSPWCGVAALPTKRSLSARISRHTSFHFSYATLIKPLGGS